jgi:hypothetical protein
MQAISLSARLAEVLEASGALRESNCGTYAFNDGRSNMLSRNEAAEMFMRIIGVTVQASMRFEIRSTPRQPPQMIDCMSRARSFWRNSEHTLSSRSAIVRKGVFHITENIHTDCSARVL